MTTTYVGIVRDHSGSMRSLSSGALKDYNILIDGIKQQSFESNQDIFVTVDECGVGPLGQTRLVEVNRPLKNLSPLGSYVANGSSTPLWDSVGELILAIESNVQMQHYRDPSTAYLVMVITDGYENSSRHWNARTLATKINQLQATDKWTFVFRVPVGNKQNLVRLGIPEGNIMEWEQTTASLAASTEQTRSGVTEYFTARTKGVTSTTKFFADLSKVSVSDVRASLEDITSKVRVAVVPHSRNGAQIRDFCNEYFGTYKTGAGYYQLTKPETVQGTKAIAIRSKVDGKIYSGIAARQMMGLPNYGNIRLVPGSLNQFDVYVQSTSVNRKLVAGTSVLYII